MLNFVSLKMSRIYLPLLLMRFHKVGCYHNSLRYKCCCLCYTEIVCDDKYRIHKCNIFFIKMFRSICQLYIFEFHGLFLKNVMLKDRHLKYFKCKCISVQTKFILEKNIRTTVEKHSNSSRGTFKQL